MTRSRRRRPVGTCALCGRAIWSFGEVRRYNDGSRLQARHVDCLPGGSSRAPGARYHTPERR